MRNVLKRLFAALCVVMLICAAAVPAFADETATSTSTSGETQIVSTSDADATATSGKANGAGIAIGFAACGGAIGMGLAVAKALEGISRQPEAEGKIRTTLMLGLVFVETAIIYALVIAILIIFVL